MKKSKQIKQIGNIMRGVSGWENPSVGRVYDQNYCAPTINTCNGGGATTIHNREEGKEDVKRRCD